MMAGASGVRGVLAAVLYGSIAACASGTIGGPNARDDSGCNTEICDGFDNDCDGAVDEDCPCDDGSQQPCYSGSPVTVGLGNCHTGIQQCGGSAWGTCLGEGLPHEEECNTLDDDCDGAVDEDCPCDDGSQQSCYSGSPITVDIGTCRKGTQLCSNDSWGACEGEVLPAAEDVCNELDDDCDGIADQGCPCGDGEQQPCYSGPPATQDVGVCAAGTQTCAAGAWGTCTGDVTPSDESCNTLDDDCDGLTDLEDEPVDVLCPPVPNATTACSGTGCVLAGCAANQVDVNGIYGDGCECAVSPSPAGAGGSCGGAIGLGNLVDASAQAVTVSGNGAPAGRTIWWAFTGVDDADSNGDEYHVDVRFLANPGNAYRMDVYRGGCSAGNRLVAGEAGSFDWYTDFAYTSNGCSVSAPCGEGNCAPSPGPGRNSCSDDTAVYYVAVTRADGLASCDGFTLELSNGVH
jgi:hypothetical protein